MDKDKKVSKRRKKEPEEIIEIKENTKEKKEIEEIAQIKKYKKEKKESELLRQMSLKKTLGLSLVVVFSIIMLVFFCNRTFFKNKYKTSKIDIDIPLLMFFMKDDGNEIQFKTYRKSQYVKDYFNNHLNNLSIYKCQDYDFFYDDLNKTAIYSIDVEKGFALKTVTIKYASGNADCLCLSGLKGKEAEEFCLNDK